MEAVQRRRVTVRGVVQGVGFRPYVYTRATGLGLAGHVTNTSEGVVAEVEGTPAALSEFCDRLAADAPPLAVVDAVDHCEVPVAGGAGFRIIASRTGGAARTLVSPDVATCADCLAELADPADRRHRHPFITCTHCGPRFTIVTGLPYDRAHTTMARFPMCPDCAREYADPADRRFHAQPVACPACGPRLRLLAGHPPRETPYDDPVAEARRLLAAGAILAVKGLGGYHLACDATHPGAVAELRRRKARGDKPFALMARDLADIEHLVHLGSEERNLLTGGVRPIVLLRRRADAGGPRPADAVAPGSPDLGVMLPYTPLHHLLLGLPGDPPGPRLLVMTSGNLAGEPIVTDDTQALDRLAGLADAWLSHDRPIHVPCDDSVVRVCDGEPLTVRRSRGYAPLPLTLPLPVPATLAVGGDLKNAFCLGEGRRAWLSAHIGDMDDLGTQYAFERAVRQLESITGVTPRSLAADRHPGYRSGQWARRQADSADARPVVRVQHHHAHIASAMAEHGLDGGRRVIGIAFDGTGYGDDGAVWGGEVLLADYAGYTRFAHLAYVPLPGGDAAVHRPYRMALAHLRAAGIAWTPDLPCVRACPADELRVLESQLERDLNCAPTSSMGRLFDAVSSLVGVCHHAGYEAQAAIELESAALTATEAGPELGLGPGPGPYAFALRRRPPESGTRTPVTADPAPVLASVVADVRAGTAPSLIAARFHASVAALVGTLCALAREEHGLDTVALTGGVFANTLLSSACARRLRENDFTVLRHHRVPPNDGGLALGQLMVAAAVRATEHPQRGEAHVPGGTRQSA
ncbi:MULTISPECIES: carbamoyltransferase HypF [unclassified Streptomyces]|uniref:carbamoyltransferase HypF n=1 Tax=unclassified Streptomyces TaxID=2593676 RepID=UPI001BE51958|nr:MULTISPECIES: carbamoyltransferase HypF [unclassified Streptomyces]MBT2406096.1 carbamoyltransferase HypF [Streptomyces sp. ISL-21]MBT2609154.1 carbamoyltransferase HypF [Streptomyces sp. ISL-87]